MNTDLHLFTCNHKAKREAKKHFQTLSVVREMISPEPWRRRTYFPRDFWSVRSPCAACRSRRNIPARKKGRVNRRVRWTTRESALDWRSVLTLWTMALRSVFMTSFTLACWVFTVGSWKTNRDCESNAKKKKWRMQTKCHATLQHCQEKATKLEELLGNKQTKSL